jgi:hypothetical protein
MIEIGTVLTACNVADPNARVVGIEAQRYMLSPSPEFGSTFAMGFDEISNAYDCSGYAVAIEPFDEQAAWRELSSKKFHLASLDARKREQTAAELPSPEDRFRADAAAEAAASKKKRR